MKLGFVIPWYGDSISGGAEAECRDTAKALSRRGFDVEILSTCVREFLSDWSVNYHTPGHSVEGGIPVRRFPVRRRNSARFDQVNYKLMHNLPVSAKEEEIFVRENVNSPALYDYIGAHAQEYVFVFTPYMFGTTYYGSQVCPERSLLIPCLHDESYAYMGVFKSMASRVAGVLTYTEPERQLVARLYGIRPDKMTVMGGGVDANWTADPERFTGKYGLRDFLLYAGRRDAGKGVPMLIDYFSRYRRETGDPVDLVLLGKGEVAIPPADASRIHDLGFISLQDKYDCFAAACFFCLPSSQESFSIVMMESWLAGTAVVAYEPCAVTKQHCLSSNGGLFFRDYEEFFEITQELRTNSVLRRKLAANGRKYVLENYTWEIVCERFMAALERWGWPREQFRCAGVSTSRV